MPVFKRLTSGLANFLLVPSSPEALAIFRIILCILLYQQTNPDWLRSMINQDDSLRVSPSLWPEDISWFFPSGAQAWLVSWIFRVSCLLGLVGLLTRPALLTCSITGFFVLGWPHFFGKVNHNHFLYWFLILLSCSPAGDAFSIDRLIKSAFGSKKIKRTQSLRYSTVIRWCWILLGLFYFSAGIRKLIPNPAPWLFGDSLMIALINKWIVLGYWMPPFRLDHYPLLLHGSAWAVAIFEITFPLLLFFPQTRVLAFVGGLTFHYAIVLLMSIRFYHLMACYVSLLDWDVVSKKFSVKKIPALLTWKRERKTKKFPLRHLRRSAQKLRLLHFVGSSILVINLFCLIFDLHTWPFASAPHFGGNTNLLNSDLEFVIKSGNSQTRFLAAEIRTILDSSAWKNSYRRIWLTSDQDERIQILKAVWDLIPLSKKKGDWLEVNKVTKVIGPNYPDLKIVQKESLFKGKIQKGLIVEQDKLTP